MRLDGYIPIAFERIYLSKTDYDSPVGHGWAHSYDLRLFRYPDGSVTLRRTCGSRGRFVPSGNSFITPPEERTNTLVDNGDGTFSLVQASGTELKFDLRGRLERVQDVHGNQLEFEYDPAGRLPLSGTSKLSPNPNIPGVVALNYRLTRIRERDALANLTGRDLNLSYDATTGRLQSVSDFTGRTWTYSHDTKGNLVSVTGPLGITSTYGYADATDPNNLTSLDEGTEGFTLKYDSQDRVTRQTLATGTIWDITYDVPGVRTTVTKTIKDDTGTALRSATTTYEFNSYGNPTKVTDALGNEFTYTRDSAGNVLTKESRENRPGVGLVLVKTVAFSYDVAGNITREIHTQQSTGESVTKEFGYDHNLVATLRTYSSLDPTYILGFDIIYAHNGRGFPTVPTRERRVISGGGTPAPIFYTLDFSHDAFGQLTQTTYPNGDTHPFSYTDAYLAGENGETMGRDARGNLLSRTDRNGGVWIYTYDALDRVLTEQDPTGSQTLHAWSGRLKTQTEIGRTVQQAGRVHYFSYDAFGRLLTDRQQTVAGLVTVGSYARDSEGFPSRIVDAEGRTERRTYDALDRMVSLTDGAGRTVTFKYDVLGNLTETTDALGRVKRYAYWILAEPGKRSAVTDGSNNTLTATLDVSGKVRTITDPLAKVVTELRDGLGRLMRFTTSSGAVTSLGYDGRGNLASRTDAKGTVTTYSYDSQAKLTGIDYPGTDAVAISRDAGGRILRAIDEDSDISLRYDAVGHIVSETNNSSGRSVSYAYNSTGERTTTTTSDGHIIQYHYNDLGHPTAIDRDGVIEVSYQPDRSGLPTRAIYANGMVVSYTRDGAGALSKQETVDATGTLLNRLELIRDSSGYILVKHEVVRRPDGTVSDLFSHYTYSPAGRLIREEIRGADDVNLVSSRDFTFDAVGNRLTMVADSGATTTYTYGPDYQVLSEVGGGQTTAYTYDANGNVLTESSGGSTVTYHYDSENRLVGLDSASYSARYSLTWDGRRLTKELNGATTEYLYDGLGIIAEYPAASSAVYYLSGPGLDRLVARQAGAQKSYYAQNEGLGSIMQLISPGGSVQNSYVYRAFGEKDEQFVAVANSYAFAGRSEDEETPHLYFRERLYAPRGGRFLSVEPVQPDAARAVRIGGEGTFSQGRIWDGVVLGNPAFINGYEYAAGNPVSNTDPTGERDACWYDTVSQCFDRDGEKCFLAYVPCGVAAYVVAAEVAAATVKGAVLGIIGLAETAHFTAENIPIIGGCTRLANFCFEEVIESCERDHEKCPRQCPRSPPTIRK